MALRVSPKGRVLVGDLSRIHLFAPDGVVERSFRKGQGGRPIQSVAFAEDGTYLATWLDEWSQKVIHRYSKAGEQIGSFCDSYAVGSDIDVRAEQMFAGGYLDVLPSTGAILYDQQYPYLVSLFDASGRLIRSFTGARKGFDEPPLFETNGDGYIADFRTHSKGAVFLPDGRIIHSTVKRISYSPEAWKTAFDLFDPEGRVIARKVIDERLVIRCADSEGRLYGISYHPFPAVERLRLSVMGGS